jgi:hypothetical protein
MEPSRLGLSDVLGAAAGGGQRGEPDPRWVYGSAARAARAPQEVDDAASPARPGPAKLEIQPYPQDGQRRRRRVMGRCLRRSPRQKLEIQPCPQDGSGSEAMLRGADRGRRLAALGSTP